MGKSPILFADCDFCRQNKTVINTPHGYYCKECLQLIIEEFEGAIEELKEAGE